MKTNLFLVLAIVGLGILSGCEKEDSSWRIENKEYTISSYSWQCSVWVKDVSSTTSLTVNIDVAAADWCTVGKISHNGASFVEIYLSVEVNLTAEERIAYVTVSDGARSEVVTITQEAGDATLSIDHTIVELEYAAGTYTVPVVTSNTSWTAALDAAATWCTLTAASGKGNGAVTINIPQEAIFRRYTTLTVSTGALRDSVIIFQHGMPVHDPGVNIDGVIWATRNVNDVGTFASPYENGKFYQCNRAVAYTSTDPLSPAWDNTYPESGTWSLINDPCPGGWRVPSQLEFQGLVASGWRWVTANEGGPGAWFGPGAQNASLYPNIPNDAVFFPSAGIRITPEGYLISDYKELIAGVVGGKPGCYWSNESFGACMYFTIKEAVNSNMWDKRRAMSIRCVKR